MFIRRILQVPTDVPKDKFGIHQYPKTVEDDSEGFPNVARLPDAMLRKVDPTNPILVAYLHTINPTIETVVLFPKGVAGTSERSKGSKKSSKV